MSHRGFPPPADDEPGEPTNLWDDEIDRMNRKPEGWDDSWDRELPKWEDVFSSSSTRDSRADHPTSYHAKKSKARRGRKRGRDGWGSY